MKKIWRSEFSSSHLHVVTTSSSALASQRREAPGSAMVAGLVFGRGSHPFFKPA